MIHVSCFMKIIAVVPAWNEEETVGETLDGLRQYVSETVVVDDGSKDRTDEIARRRGAVVVRHALNRGLGAALKTGMMVALVRSADVVVTFDADGQHAPEDVPAVVKPILDGKADAVIGTRLHDRQGMPAFRRIANHAGNLVTWALFGVRTTDSQSGFRAFSREAAARIELKTDRMEVSSEILAEVARLNLRLVHVPIASRYTAYSMSKGQSFTMGIRTLGRLLAHRVRR